MKAPIEWLKEFVKIDVAPETLADSITMGGVEVGAIEFHGKNIKDVVVGKIKHIESHATKNDVFICDVDTGAKILQIVTKATNLKVGDRVPVALHGATLPSGMKIEARELHGVESFGMLCSTMELGLTDSAEAVPAGRQGIMILDVTAPIGQDIKKVLGIGGAVLDVDVLPNRIDLLSIMGIAREIGAVTGRKTKLPLYRVKETASERTVLHAKVEVKDKDLCPRYMARVIKGVKIGPSPKWMEERLIACGMRPINNVVDITNYVLLECGQPLHAFDLNKLKDHTVIVRRAKKGEKMVTLDNEARHLSHDMLVIADPEKAVAIAGIMGGLDSEVTQSTVDILLESAYFEPKSIHRTEKELKVRTESSTRFDRGVDWNMVPIALDRAASLLAQLAGGTVLKHAIDIKAHQRKPKQIKLRPERVNAILGTDIKHSEIMTILDSLGFTMKGHIVEVPLFRAGDIEREIDLIEEIARIHGYDNIPVTLPAVKMGSGSVVKEKQINVIRAQMISGGFYEAVTYSMLPQKDPINFDIEHGGKISLQNPITEDLSVMRTSLIPGLLKCLCYNLDHQVEDVNLFEVGKVYYKDQKGTFKEHVMLGAVLCGRRTYRYDSIKDMPDLFQLKNLVNDVLNALDVKYEYKECSVEGFDPGKSASVVINGQVIGVLGCIHPAYNDVSGVNVPIYAISLDIEALLGVKPRSMLYKEIPSYPSVKRDIAMLVPIGVAHKAIVDHIVKAGGSLVEGVMLFDMYKGKQVEPGFYSLAYSITYRDPSKTLTDDIINQKHAEIIDNLAKDLSVKLRK